MLQALADLAGNIRAQAALNPPGEQAQADQIAAMLRDTFERHGIALTGALGCVVLETAQSILRLIVDKALADPKTTAGEPAVEIIGYVAEWAASLIEQDAPNCEECPKEPCPERRTALVVPAYVYTAPVAGPQGARS